MNYKLFILKMYNDLFTTEKRFQKWNDLEKRQWMSLSEMTNLQLLKLKETLIYSIENVASFSNVKENLNSNDSVIDILNKFPVTDKSFYRSEGNKSLSRNIKNYKYIKSSTSGSTGENFFFYLDITRLAWARAAEYLGDSWAGILPHHRRAGLWGARFDQKKVNKFEKFFKDFLTPSSFLSSYNLSEESIRNYISIIQKNKPEMILCYPSPMFEFASYCKKNNVKFPFLRSIISSAEQLFDFQKELIERTFNVPVFNRYGNREFGLVAQECDKHSGFHVLTDRVYVEILDDNNNPCRPGELGNLVITELNNRVMPLIRYRIGDLASWSHQKQCTCGRGYPLLEKVEGRAFDVVRTPNGTVISGTFWTLLMRHISEDIKAFQIIQNSIDKIAINIQMHDGKSLNNEKLNFLKEKIKEKDKDIQIEITFCETIKLTKSGKKRFVISNLK